MPNIIDQVEKEAKECLSSLIELLSTPPLPEVRPSETSVMPKALLYVDEAHSTQISLLNDLKHRTNYAALTRAIDSLKAMPLLAVFTSTTSRLYDLAPPQMVHSSDRVMGNDTIPLPFWELPFDVNVGKISRGSLTLKEITATEHIVKFGRPL